MVQCVVYDRSVITKLSLFLVLQHSIENSSYRKIPIISPRLWWTYLQGGGGGGLFSAGLIIGGNFAFQNGLGLTIKTALNNKKKTAQNSYP